MIPSGTPMTVPSPTATLDCQATTARQLAPGEPERLEQRQVPAASSDRGQQGQPEGQRGTEGEAQSRGWPGIVPIER